MYLTPILQVALQVCRAINVLAIVYHAWRHREPSLCRSMRLMNAYRLGLLHVDRLTFLRRSLDH